MAMKPKLNRREILERMTAVTGGAISLSILAACDAGVTLPDISTGADLKALDQVQLDLVGDIADMIIPDTDTPGAKSVNVHYLVDELVANWMLEKDKEAFLEDLTALDERIKAEQVASFSDLDQERRGVVLDQLGTEMLVQNGAAQVTGDNATGRKHIYLELRELIIFGYYTSEVGATKELIHDPIPGEYHGCIPFSEGGRAYSH